ncbi:MAG: ATP-dependent Clp protease ClpS [Gemmatales bacterium]|nr:MAG: ATP-dependent Clp protease ClpS [Gemmatales bacterium]
MSADKPAVSENPKTHERNKVRRVPPYHVILENDDVHTFEFVVGVLRKSLGYSQERAYQLTLLAHRTGQAVVWTGPKEVAELKVEQIRTYHETRDDGLKLGPVGCRIEPAPGS